MYVAKNILNKTDINDLYQRMLNEPFWRIGATYQGLDDPASHHPRSIAMNSNGVYNPFIAGYFTAVVNRIRDKIRDDYGFEIPAHSLDTIGFNAERKGNISSFHRDVYNGEPFTWSIVGFLTPQWDPSWGGELQIEDRTYTFEPGDFVLFKSNEYHDSLPIKVDTPFWRISVACLIK
tara:strand:- start:38 stop:568 length:531 start_codon:yes stop_codon:yes gene_type:complete